MGQAAGVQRCVGDDVERRHVEGGQRGREHVLGRVALGVGDVRGVEEEEVMRVDDTLRRSRRAGGELDQRRVAAVGQLRRGIAAASLEPAGQRQHARATDRRRQLVRRAGHEHELDLPERLERIEVREQVRARDQHPRIRLDDHPLEQQPARVGVQRHRHAARRESAIEDREELDLVAHVERDVTGPAELLDHGVAKTVGEHLRLAECQPLRAVEHEPGVVGTLAGLLVEHVEHGPLLEREARDERPQPGPPALEQLLHLSAPRPRRLPPSRRAAP